MNNRIIIKPGTILSHIDNEEYIPLRVVYDSSIESIHFVGFYYKDTDLLEFAVDKETGLVRKMQIVVCSHFQFVDNEYPSEKADDAVPYLYYPQHNDCSIFRLTVYKNAVKVVISNKAVSVFFRCGQVIYGLSSSGELVSVLITNMSVKDIAHTQSELSIGIEQ